MKRSLLLLGVIAALAIGGPAYSQYIYMDADGDGNAWCPSGTTDALSSSTTAVDIWLDTNHNMNGTAAGCKGNATQSNTIFSYDLLFIYSGSGSVTYNSWTNADIAYTQTYPLTVAGSSAGVSYGRPTSTPAGKYKLGTLNITVTGQPVLNFRTDNVGVEQINTTQTAFGSDCDGTDYPNTITLGIDFNDACGTQSTVPVTSTTWGKIKQLYK